MRDMRERKSAYGGHLLYVYEKHSFPLLCIDILRLIVAVLVENIGRTTGNISAKQSFNGFMMLRWM